MIYNKNAKGNIIIATYERLLFLEIDSQSYRVVSHHRSIAILRQWVFSVLDYCYISRSSSVLLHYWVVVLTHWNNVQKWLIVPVRRTNIGIGNKELLLQTREVAANGRIAFRALQVVVFLTIKHEGRRRWPSSRRV